MRSALQRYPYNLILTLQVFSGIEIQCSKLLQIDLIEGTLRNILFSFQSERTKIYQFFG